MFALAYSRSGALLATGGADGIVRLYDMPQHKLVATLPNGPKRGAVNSVAFAPSGAMLATGSSDGRVRLFTVSQDKLALVRTAIANTPSNPADQTPVSGEYGIGVNGVAFAPSGSTLAAGSQDGKVRLFSVSGRNLRLLHTVSPGDAYDSVTSVAFAPGGAVIAAGIGDGMVQLVGVSARGLRLGGADRGAAAAHRNANRRDQRRVRSRAERCSRPEAREVPSSSSACRGESSRSSVARIRSAPPPG